MTDIRKLLALSLVVVGCNAAAVEPDTDPTSPPVGDPSPIPGVECVGWAGSRCIRAGVPDDMDGDFYTADVDCNDRDMYVYPGAPQQTDCGGPDWDCDGEAQPPCPPDDDGDGWALGADCDDADASIHPGVTDVPCNGVDEDCSGGLAADHCDRDGDGSIVPYDCDDADPARIATGPYPMDAVCDGIDNDCDGSDCCDNDADGDGHDCRTDCNDWNQLIHPGAEPSAECDATADLNCDGVIDMPCL